MAFLRSHAYDAVVAGGRETLSAGAAKDLFLYDSDFIIGSSAVRLKR